MRKQRSGQGRQTSPPKGSWSDLPIRIANLTWSQWWRTTLYSAIMLILVAVILVILSGPGNYVTDLVRFFRLL